MSGRRATLMTASRKSGFSRRLRGVRHGSGQRSPADDQRVRGPQLRQALTHPGRARPVRGGGVLFAEFKELLAEGTAEDALQLAPSRRAAAPTRQGRPIVQRERGPSPDSRALASRGGTSVGCMVGHGAALLPRRDVGGLVCRRRAWCAPRDYIAGGSPPVWANVLLTIVHLPSICARVKKSVMDTVPQNPCSSSTAKAASPTCSTEITRVWKLPSTSAGCSSTSAISSPIGSS